LGKNQGVVDQPIQIEEQRLKRKSLPHLENGGRAYFVTLTARRYLKPEDRKILIEIIKSGAALNRYWLYVGVVMPDHLHVIVRPIIQSDGKFPALSTIVQSWKSFFSRQTGTRKVFQEEAYDRVIRTDEWPDTTEYIRLNPVRAGLSSSSTDYPYYFKGDFE
jgi:REP element-mobilizing transposase RayT